MAFGILLKKWTKPAGLGVIEFDEGWLRRDVGRVTLSVSNRFFRVNGTWIRSCLRQVVAHVFGTRVERVRRGLTMVWTVYKHDLAIHLDVSTSISISSMRGADAFIEGLLWVLEQGLDIQRRLVYDPRAMRCVLPRGDAGGGQVLRSPRFGKRPRRRAFRIPCVSPS